jgi:type 1 glutamine amidotransferase
MKILRVLLLLGLAVLASCESPPSYAAGPKIKVLIVDGYSNHNWQLTTRLLKELLGPTHMFSVSVSTTPSPKSTEGWDKWRPSFKDYDVVIQTCNDINNSGPEWPAAVQKDFEDYVRNGGGVYIFHAAENAFADWPAYNEMIGLGWRPASYGTAIMISSDEQLIRIPPGQGRATSHGTRGDVVVHQLGDHPIHQGMPRAWLTPGLEVYYDARGPAENIQILSYGRDPRYGENWPIEWTVAYGQGRVYVSTFGHVWADDTDPESMRCVGVQTTIIRALQWLAKRPVTYPIPPDFPTATQKSIRPAKT